MVPKVPKIVTFLAEEEMCLCFLCRLCGTTLGVWGVASLGVPLYVYQTMTLTFLMLCCLHATMDQRKSCDVMWSCVSCHVILSFTWCQVILWSCDVMESSVSYPVPCHTIYAIIAFCNTIIHSLSIVAVAAQCIVLASYTLSTCILHAWVTVDIVNQPIRPGSNIMDLS